MPDTESIIVNCARGELPAIGERVHAEQGPDNEHGVTWVLATVDRHLPATGMIDESHDDVDMSYISGAVDRIEEMHPIPQAFPNEEAMLRHASECGPSFAVWVLLDAPHPDAEQPR